MGRHIMTSSNTDRVVGLIVDSMIDSMRPQLQGKVPDAAVNAMRSAAVLAASSAIPPPIRLAINAVPPTAFHVVENAAASGVQNIREGAQNIKDKTSQKVETVKGLLKGK